MEPAAFGGGARRTWSRARRAPFSRRPRVALMANGLPLVVANRVGLEPSPDREDRTISFWGNAFVTSAAGEIVARGVPAPRLRGVLPGRGRHVPRDVG